MSARRRRLVSGGAFPRAQESWQRSRDRGAAKRGSCCLLGAKMSGSGGTDEIKVAYDEKYQRNYYYNKRTKKTGWSRKEVEDPAAVKEGDQLRQADKGAKKGAGVASSGKICDGSHECVCWLRLRLFQGCSIGRGGALRTTIHRWV